MRRIAYIILLLICALACTNEQKYVVGFYNVENLFDTYDDPEINDEEFLPEGANHWTEDKYRKKLSNIAQVLCSIKDQTGSFHAVLGLAEVENRLVLEDLVAEQSLSQADYHIVHYDSPDRRGIDVALLYRPDCFEYIDSESIPFSFVGADAPIELSAEEQAAFRTRDILMVRGKMAGEDIAIYVAHLPSRVGGKGGDLRPRGAEIIYDHAMELRKVYPGIKVIVMGDMNDNPSDISMTDYLHGVSDIAQVGKDDFFSPFADVLASGVGTLSYRGEWNIYDIIMVDHALSSDHKGLHILPNSAGFYGTVFERPFMTQQEGRFAGTPFRTFSYGEFIGGYSDHYPTYIEIGK